MPMAIEQVATEWPMTVDNLGFQESTKGLPLQTNMPTTTVCPPWRGLAG